MIHRDSFNDEDQFFYGFTLGIRSLTVNVSPSTISPGQAAVLTMIAILLGLIVENEPEP